MLHAMGDDSRAMLRRPEDYAAPFARLAAALRIGARAVLRAAHFVDGSGYERAERCPIPALERR